MTGARLAKRLPQKLYIAGYSTRFCNKLSSFHAFYDLEPAVYRHGQFDFTA